MYAQRENQKRENIRKFQREIRDLKNTTSLKNIIVEFNSGLNEAEKRISECKDKSVAFIR